MCELLGMSAHHPASITLSLNEFARHGGETGPHVDGWGVAFYEGPDANLIRESTAAADSVLMSTLRDYRLISEIVIAHIRRASFGPVELRNTHPFRRELAGRVHTFAHNGDLPGIEDRYRLDPKGTVVPVGTTDSEHAFCMLMQRLSRLWIESPGIPSLHARRETVFDFAREIGKLGSANFLYSDGDVMFVHGHVRQQADGSIRAPGLHYISVSCNYGLGHSELASVKLESDQVQKVTLVSTIPLNDGDWQPLQAGELLILKGGEVVDWVSESGDSRQLASA
ncbi:MAG: class II glutamine amidotransferase [Gammaproteobacteria bacterium]|nr:class II glutamine amidotransferase [Gammaproteobacteria bacterium]MCP5092869.1 class II glutamine amidotransferase [Gammaproteobacteria bacterium]